eukprot:TRINITY_DN21183_c0_g1_i3.p1 TRINITY_DN21183_c0_g1~~TRINITY_DN21183_c0_g1_i3.p1  ORF type:complete len:965 (+),score=193.99 TRINITY_DN21183_c0_g1_i3:64-2958(+)
MASAMSQEGGVTAADASDEAGNDFLEKLLEMLQESQQGQCDKTKMRPLLSTINSRKPADLVAITCKLVQILYQLRAWYTDDVGVLCLFLFHALVEVRPSQALPRFQSEDTCMCILRLLEGLVLICTAPHAKKETIESLDLLLQNRLVRLPPCTSVRLEAALVALEGASTKRNIPKAPSLTQELGDEWLRDLARTLEPSDEARSKMELAKVALEKAVSAVFKESKAHYFGSSVNGFETKASDVDCVIQLAQSDLDWLAETAQDRLAKPDADDEQRNRAFGAAAAKALGEALRTDAALQELRLEVVEVVADARVPLLKCRSQEKIDVDISFNNLLPLHNSRLLQHYALLDRRVQDLGRIVKWWAKKRSVNDAQTGTLSSYSHTLLVIHYLQHLGFIENLQDKTWMPAETENELLDGRHDVWFYKYLDSDVPEDKEKFLGKAAGEDAATLAGLLCGFFRYYAYEVPFHSQVVSIRHPEQKLLSKLEYFRSLKAADAPDNPGPAEQPEAAAVDDSGPGCSAEAEDDALTIASDAGGSSASEELLMLQQDDASEPKVVESATTRLAQLQQKYKLPLNEEKVQSHMSRKQVLCIDDPMEAGRTLGPSFAGMERLAFEWRRACEMLSSKQPNLDKLFEESKARHLRELQEQRNFPHLVQRIALNGSRQQRDGQYNGGRAEASAEVQVPSHRVGALMGSGGSYIKQLQAWRGISTIRMDDNAGVMRIKGTDEAVKEVSEMVRQRVQEVRSKSLWGAPPRASQAARNYDADYDRGSVSSSSKAGSKQGGKAAGGGSNGRLWAPTGNRQTPSEAQYGRRRADDDIDSTAGGGSSSSKDPGAGKGNSRPVAAERPERVHSYYGTSSKAPYPSGASGKGWAPTLRFQAKEDEDDGWDDDDKPKKKKESKPANMHVQDLKPYIGYPILPTKSAKGWEKGEKLFIEGGTDTSWKVRSRDGQRHFAFRKDDEGVSWEWE